MPTASRHVKASHQENGNRINAHAARISSRPQSAEIDTVAVQAARYVQAESPRPIRSRIRQALSGWRRRHPTSPGRVSAKFCRRFRFHSSTHFDASLAKVLDESSYSHSVHFSSHATNGRQCKEKRSHAKTCDREDWAMRDSNSLRKPVQKRNSREMWFCGWFYRSLRSSICLTGSGSSISCAP